MKRINLVLTPETLIQTRKDLAGTERVFLNHLDFLSKKKGYQVTSFYRADRKKGTKKKVYFPLWPISFSRYLQKIPILRKFQGWEDVGSSIAQTIYIFTILLQSKKNDYFISYSFPLLTLFSPERVISTLHAPPHFYLSHLGESRYKRGKYLFCSQYLLDETIKRYSFLNTADCGVLSNAVDKKLFHPPYAKKKPNKKTRMLFCGAWVKEKGLDILLDALLALPKADKDKFELTIASHPNLWYYDDRKYLGDYIDHQKEKIRLLPNVKLLNGVSQKELAKLYHSHDWLLFPSIWEEPSGLIIIEAIASDLPLIHFGTGGIKEIVSSSNSVQVKDKTSDALSRKLSQIINKKIHTIKRPLWRQKNEQMDLDYHNNKLFAEIKKLEQNEKQKS